jgi:medium-chain acyl-[acyl-carrier-protein] hydrolase
MYPIETQENRDFGLQAAPAKPRCLTKAPKTAGVRLRLFCFPYAGAAAQVFHPWERALPKHVDLCPVQPPGRGNRMSEVSHRNLFSLVDQISDDIAEWLDVPFVFFGHSLGALVAFELARQLRRQCRPQPLSLLLSACRAPEAPVCGPVLHRLSERELIEELRKLRGTPEEVLSQPQLLRFVLSPLRADLEVFETYAYRPEAPLACPIHAFAGTLDERAPVEAVRGWGAHTAQLFTLKTFPGGHFFIRQSDTLFLENLQERLASLY